MGDLISATPRSIYSDQRCVLKSADTCEIRAWVIRATYEARLGFYYYFPQAPPSSRCRDGNRYYDRGVFLTWCLIEVLHAEEAPVGALFRAKQLDFAFDANPNGTLLGPPSLDTSSRHRHT